MADETKLNQEPEISSEQTFDEFMQRSDGSEFKEIDLPALSEIC